MFDPWSKKDIILVVGSDTPSYGDRRVQNLRRVSSALSL
jgi:hypothetical protein